MDREELKVVFDRHFKHVKFDQRLARGFYGAVISFMNKNQEHMEFFGGVLTGVQRVRFTSQEFNYVTDTLLKLDQQHLKRDFARAEAIVIERDIAGDLFNFILAYCAHRFWTSPLLSTTNRQKAARDVIMLSTCRSLAALMVKNFRYLVDINLATRVYDRMSRRFILKKVGSWKAYLEYRGDRVLDETYPHIQTMVTFGDGQAVVNWAVDTHNRPKETLKEIYDILVVALSENDRMKQGSLITSDMEGEEVIVDKTGGTQALLDHLVRALPDEHTFIRHELLPLVLKVVRTAPPHLVEKTLKWLSDNALSAEGPAINTMLVDAANMAFLYIDANELDGSNTDLGKILISLRNMFMASRAGSDEIEALRTNGSVFVERATGNKNGQVVAAVRTAVFLYAWLRAYTKQYFVH